MHKTCYLVGGGSSLRSFDWSLLDNKFVIAINRAYEVLPRANIVYFTDASFWTDHREYLIQHTGKLIRGVNKLGYTEVKRVEEYLFTGEEGLETKPGCLRSGRNSGYAAINLAFHLGFNQIYLLGYDMKFGVKRDRSTSHWHSGYRKIDPEGVYPMMLRYFSTIVEPLKENKIQVINVVKDQHSSELNTFEKKLIDEVFAK